MKIAMFFTPQPRHVGKPPFRLLLSTVLTLILLETAWPQSARHSAKHLPDHRPNIILLLADDLGFGDLGFNGQQKIRTPQIDQLARDGRVYTDFYAGTSICAPSRSTLLTGQHTGHTYIRGNKSVPPEGQQPLPLSSEGLVTLLQRSGYHTAAFGKWGLGPIGSTGDPLKQGFDHFFGYNSQSLAHRYYPDHLWSDDRRIALAQNASFTQQIVYGPDLIQRKALAYIQEQQPGEPFFLFLPYILPHAELIVPEDSIFEYYKGRFPETPYKGRDYGPGAVDHGYASQRYPHAAFAAMVTLLDHYLGQIRSLLQQKGLDSNTLIVFTSDNGPHIEGGADPAFFNSNGPFRGVKRDLYEGGIRVPFIACQPGTIKAGSQSGQVSALWDLYPTFLELAGLKDKIPQDIDGLSMAGDLTGHTPTNPKAPRYLYFELHEQGGKQAVIWEGWKGIRLNVDQDPDGKIELYHLKEDPAETLDQSGQYPDILQKMDEIMRTAHMPSALFPFAGEKKQRVR